MKKAGFLCIIIVVSLCVSVSASAAEPIKVVLGGQILQFDVQPTIIDDRTMVPMRVIFEALGADVEWDGTNQTITAKSEDVVVITIIGNRTMIVNGNATTMDVAPILIDGRTLVPARFVSEAFGCDVEWDANARMVYINYGGTYTPYVSSGDSDANYIYIDDDEFDGDFGGDSPLIMD